jgi:hypothetical protein
LGWQTLHIIAILAPIIAGKLRRAHFMQYPNHHAPPEINDFNGLIKKILVELRKALLALAPDPSACRSTRLHSRKRRLFRRRFA